MKNNYNAYITNKLKKTTLLVITIVLSLLILGVVVDFNVVRIVRGIPSMYDLFERMLHPNISYTKEVFSKLLETIEIAITSSLLGVVSSIPFAFLTSRNIAPSKSLSIFLNAIFSIFRTIPSLIWAALLVSVFSIGKFSGLIALTIIAFLMSLKLFKENIETINENLLNSVRSVGANKIQVLRFCVIPTILEIIVSVFFIVFETNIRSATILGLVGAGGIGQIMWRDLNHLRYDNLATLVLILFLTILIIDATSMYIRRRMKKSFVKYSSIQSYKIGHKLKITFYTIMFMGIMVLAMNTIDIDIKRLKIGVEQGSSIIIRMAKVDFSYMNKLIEGVKESFAIAIFATIMGSIISLALSYFTAYNTSPTKKISVVFKGIINVLRTFPPIVTAIIFFRGVGPGPLAGSMALTIYTSGVLTKLYSEVIENSHENIKNSILVTGTTKFNSFRHGILPHTLSNFISLSLYRLESNIRNSTILGIIGAGGIGTTLSMNITWRNWEKVGLLVLGISVMVIIIDTISSYLRKKLL